MTLEEHIQDIKNKLNDNEYTNEQSISQGIVLRILQEIGWQIYDTQLVVPEYSVKGGRVDFALCCPPQKPIIFIEVKQPGNIRGADEQLFQYAFHKGIPFVIVTDGKEWHFYLPGETGNYEERRVYNLDLLEREIGESSRRIMRYLSFKNVKNGLALEKAKEDYKDVSKKRETESTIPIAWEKLLEERDEILIEVISEKVESICGYKASEDLIIKHLSSLHGKTQYLPNKDVGEIKNHSVAENTNRPMPKPSNVQSKTKRVVKKIRVTFPDGTVIENGAKINIQIETMKKIGFKKVESLGIMRCNVPIISREIIGGDNGQYLKEWKQADDMYIFSCSSTEEKLSILEQINRRLSLGLKIENIKS